MNKIFLKLDKEPDTIEELITELYNYPRTTGTGIYKLLSVETYTDDGKVDCGRGKYRSIDDIIAIVRTYFPKTPYLPVPEDIEIFQVLLNLVITKKDITYYPCLVACPNIYKPTFFLRNKPYVCDYPDDFTEKSNYNWREVWESLGFRNGDEVKNHIDRLK